MGVTSIEKSVNLISKTRPFHQPGKDILPATYKVLNPKVSKLDTLSLVSAGIVFFTNIFGGTSLLYDQFVDHKKGKRPSLASQSPQTETTPFTLFEQTSITPVRDQKNKKEEVKGVKTIVPTSDFAKQGIAITKFGIVMTSIAGILNGVSMGVPLQSFGDAFYFVAAPIIETPIGLGLMSIGLGSIFAGRALQLDPRYVIDKNIFHGLPSVSKKIAYVTDNIVKSYAELAKSAGLLVKKGASLLTQHRKEAVEFFKDNVFSSKSKIMLIQEYMNKEGKIFVQKAFKTSPYFMQAASFLLIAGGGILVLASMIKNNLAQKFGLRTLEVGGVVDTVSGIRWGLEKTSISTDTLGKTSGNIMALGCLAGTLGQPGLDEKWGRGLYWFGNGLIYLFFALERLQGLKHFYKHKGSQQELLKLMRQWEVDLRKIFPAQELKQNLQKVIDTAYKDKPFHHATLESINQATKNVFNNHNFILDNPKAVQNLEAILGDKMKYLSSPDNVTPISQIPETMKHLKAGSKAIFGDQPQIV